MTLFPCENESESHSVISDLLRLHELYSPWDSPGQNNGVGSHSIPLSKGSSQARDHLNPGLLHFRQILYQLNHQGSPCIRLYCTINTSVC